MNQHTAKLLLAQRARIDAIDDSLARMRAGVHFYQRVDALYFGNRAPGCIGDLLHLYAHAMPDGFARLRFREQLIRTYGSVSLARARTQLAQHRKAA